MRSRYMLPNDVHQVGSARNSDRVPELGNGEMMIFSPINKLILYAVILAGLLFGVFMLDKSRQRIGYDRAVAEYNVKLIAAKEDAKAQEMAWQSVIKDEQKRTNDAINKRDAAYAGAVNTIAGLRDTIGNLGNSLPVDTSTACSARISALSLVFAECTERLAEMGRAAQGQFVDAVACRESWPESSL